MSLLSLSGCGRKRVKTRRAMESMQQENDIDCPYRDITFGAVGKSSYWQALRQGV